MFTITQTTLDETVISPVLLDPQAETHLISENHREIQTNLQSHVDSAIRRIDSREMREAAQTILEQVVRLLDWLCLIETNLHKLDTLQENLSLLELVHLEARSLLESIESEAGYMNGISESFCNILDGITYSISHDLRRVFECELMGPIADQPTPVVFGKIVHAHGLLTNCLQQSTITLVQLFDPERDASTLFNDSQERLKQSLLLSRDLWSLIRLVRRAEKSPDSDSLSSLVKQILQFRDGSMQYLMYRDWKGYESLALEIIVAVDNGGDPEPLLHRFLCYLETLFGHVRMRAVLTNMVPSAGDAP